MERAWDVPIIREALNFAEAFVDSARVQRGLLGSAGYKVSMVRAGKLGRTGLTGFRRGGQPLSEHWEKTTSRVGVASAPVGPVERFAHWSGTEETLFFGLGNAGLESVSIDFIHPRQSRGAGRIGVIPRAVQGLSTWSGVSLLQPRTSKARQQI